jgi:hypothetical protein
MVASARKCRPWLAGLLVAASCGCGSGTATVSGKVTYKDRPVTYGSVIFVGADDKSGSAAINPDGSYTASGVPPGEARIAVISRAPSKGRANAKGRANPAEWFPIPRGFESPSTSGLSCTLKSGANEHDIKLQ